MLKYFITCSFLCAFNLLFSQQPDYLKELEVKVLEANLARNISAMDAEIARNNYTKANANMVPVVGLIAGDQLSYTSNVNKSADGRTTQNGFRINNSFSAGIEGTVSLLNGGRNKNLYDRFGILVESADLHQRRVMEDLVYRTRNIYYQAIWYNSQVSATRHALDYTNQRLQLAENKLDIGTGNKVEVLQAQLDKNQYQSAIIQYQQQLQNLEIELLTLINMPAIDSIRIVDTTYMLSELNRDLLWNSLLQNNTLLRQNLIDNKLAINSEADIRGQWKPRLDASLGYLFSRADNGGGFFLVNMSNGLVGGVNLNVPIYDGKKIRSQIRNAQIAVRQNQLEGELLKTELKSMFDQAYNNYVTSVDQARLQNENVRLAEENMTIGLARFRVGVTDGFEFKQIQQSYIDTYFTYINALYQAKVNELELQRQTGTLLSQ